jgi:hypothetical protein
MPSRVRVPSATPMLKTAPEKFRGGFLLCCGAAAVVHFFEPSKKRLSVWWHALSTLRIPPCRRRLVGIGRTGHCGCGGRIRPRLRRNRQTCRTRCEHGARTRGDTYAAGHNEPAGSGGCSATRHRPGAHSSGAHAGPSTHLRPGADLGSADLRARSDLRTAADLRARADLCTGAGRPAAGTHFGPSRGQPVLLRRTFVVIGYQQVDLDDAAEPRPYGRWFVGQQGLAAAHHLQGVMTTT